MKILMWGTGMKTGYLYEMFQEFDIIGFIDSYNNEKFYAGKKIYNPYEVLKLDYDAIIVATIYSYEIKETCLEIGIPLEKVIFAYAHIEMLDMNKNYDFIETICGRKLTNYIKYSSHIISDISENLNLRDNGLLEKFKNDIMYRNDYVRIKTLDLLSKEIEKNNVAGEIAELGVFRGDFAKIMNCAFNNRKLYLFDTFTGFDINELYTSVKTSASKSFEDTFKKTSEQIVIDKMTNKENVIIKKGYFPHSLDELEEEFAFVSLDCDFEESLFQGLKYFYPRLSIGGYIMMHDYNGHIGENAKTAILRWEKEIGKSIPKVPICDSQGSIVLTK